MTTARASTVIFTRWIGSRGKPKLIEELGDAFGVCGRGVMTEAEFGNVANASVFRYIFPQLALLLLEALQNLFWRNRGTIYANVDRCVPQIPTHLYPGDCKEGFGREFLGNFPQRFAQHHL